jgi:Nucleotidyltransferase domain
MHIYAFGSVCRGEISFDSDIDLLALVKGHDPRLDPSKYSIYSYEKIKLLWLKGSPFAWHLFLESRLLFAQDQSDYLKTLGMPASYLRYVADCEKFFNAFVDAYSSLADLASSSVFDLSTVFLSIRNVSTCFALGVLGKPIFSRGASLCLPKEFAPPISRECYQILERSRILCTRAQGSDISGQELSLALSEFEMIRTWMMKLLAKAREYERIQQ